MASREVYLERGGSGGRFPPASVDGFLFVVLRTSLYGTLKDHSDSRTHPHRQREFREEVLPASADWMFFAVL